MAAIAEEHVVHVTKPTTGSSSGDDSWKVPRTPPRRRWTRSVLLAATAVFLMISLVEVQEHIDDKNVARFTVDLAAVEGLNATTTTAGGGRTVVSPAFRLAARLENRRVLTAWCFSGGQAVVSYGGVSLAWARVPGFCAPRNGGAAEVVVEAEGKGVGLSDELRWSFVEEWEAGTARVVVEMRLEYYGNGWLTLAADHGVALVWRELPLPRQGHGDLS